MKIDRIHDVVLSRILRLAGSDAPVLITVGRPEQFPDSHDYFCPYQVTGLGRDHVRYGAGVDPMQAMLLTLKMIGADVYSSAAYKAGKLSWLEEGNPDLGLPVPEGFERPS
jgi:hypothetical protein